MSNQTIPGVEDWRSGNHFASGDAEPGNSSSSLSTIVPIVFGLLIGIGLGVFFLTKPSADSKPTVQVAKKQSWSFWSFGGKPGTGEGRTLREQQQDTERRLQQIQDDINDRLRNQWRPGG